MNQTGATDKLRLYKASINCNWKSARKILDQKPGLQNEILNEREETALHVVAAATAEPKKMRRFVTKLLGEMTDEKKKSKNKGDYTALYLAAVAGNLEFVKIMVPVDPRTVGPMTVGSSIVELGRGFLGGVKKAVALCGNDDKVDTVDSSTLELGRTLLTIRGSGGKVRRKDMPLHAAALYGKYDIVKYILDHAVTNFGEVGWDEFNRDRFLEKCVEYDMFDIALEIVKKYLRPVSESPVTKPNSIWTNIKSGKHIDLT
ncbi:hypothetical protein L1987_36938 [Smallanthus sonchifolius]|uniref:Uncharacterized protein n=1 Tax=Smallanthus sonchifolius TaxID=185202 RepID=A0ACB9HEU0_9ASTR|nr:hypothetical protein L1987_36938 [Smallanthus sonchifolius]